MKTLLYFIIFLLSSLSVNAENGTIENFRKVVKDLITTESWQTAFAGSATYVLDNGNKDSLVNKVNAAIELNTN